ARRVHDTPGPRRRQRMMRQGVSVGPAQASPEERMHVVRRTGSGITVTAMLATGLWMGTSADAGAQTSNTRAPVVVGHFHLNVTSVEAHKKFWADTLGGQA